MALCIRHRLLIQLWLQYNHTYIISCHAPENNIHRKNINFRAGEYYYKNQENYVDVVIKAENPVHLLTESCNYGNIYVMETAIRR